MLLTADIGNSNIVLGGLDHEKTYFNERISTDHSRGEIEYSVLIYGVLLKYNLKKEDFDGAILCSVVPEVTMKLKGAIEDVLHLQVILVGPNLKTGLNIIMDNPASVGADLYAGAVGAVKEYGAPVIVFDLGTASTAIVVDKDKNYIGGMILPGMRISLDALSARCSQLPGIDIRPPRQLIGKNTIDCMTSGIVYSNAAILDGLIDRIEDELGTPATAVATGGLAKFVVPYCRRKVELNEDLLLKGLMEIYEMNK